VLWPFLKAWKSRNRENELSSFWLDEFDRSKFDELSNGIKEIIAKSDEYKAMGGNGFDSCKDWRDVCGYERRYSFMQPFNSGLWRSV
jgi:hypothetical protein